MKYATTYFICEILNFFNAISQIFLTYFSLVANLKNPRLTEERANPTEVIATYLAERKYLQKDTPPDFSCVKT